MIGPVLTNNSPAIEARAIQSVFFPDGQNGELTVGSIKTVVGHTEGTAGIAGVLKASLALQHGQIPANLHFEKLNPRIQPYYTNLRVPTETSPWPAIPQGSPRRVSVNSFGFGGTNAHAILESFEGDAAGSDSGFDSDSSSQVSDPDLKPAQAVGPFVLSANSSAALAANAGALASYLRTHDDADLMGLAYTLFRRTSFPFRASFSATTSSQLATKLEQAQTSLQGRPNISPIPETLPPRILGVFTGQGAQWATMGKELYGTSEPFRRAIDDMQQSLDALPAADRPDWRLADQLAAPAETSRVAEAAVSQPLCTALQVALVDSLSAAGIEFAAVVGHSSGEIAAAYTAGYLDASDAIRVAYYRGMHARHAQGPAGRRGKMMAVGMSWSQATAFCAEFDGALVAAASNSQTSCTLAGDAEAIDKAAAQLKEKGTFARVLQVDTAYHSHHMKPSGAPYLESMRECGVKVQKRRGQRCQWYSSVWGPNGRIRSFDQVDGKLLEGQYWVDNMTQPVLFSQALTRALDEDHVFDLALEVGPHPALKGPSSETIKTLTGVPIPYASALKRGQHAAESLTEALGTVWTLFPSKRPTITFDGVRQAFQDTNMETRKTTVLKGLPPYAWNHPTLIWKESRTSRLFRTQSQGRHEILGHPIVYGERDKREVHWKQLLRLNELPWLSGHVIEGEVLFPASGYLSMAYEAAIRLVDGQQQLRLVELHDVDIVRAMRVEADSSGLEVLFTIRVTSQSDDCITAEVACYSGPVDAPLPLDAPQAALSAHFTGGVRLWLGQPDEDVLPRRTESALPMDAMDLEQVYSSFHDVGMQYASPFKATAMLRRLHQATVTVAPPPESSSLHACMHPVPVDTAVHGLLAGFSFPSDGRASTIYLPTKVDCVRISMVPSPSSSSHAQKLTADATVTSVARSTVVGDIDLFNAADSHTLVQIRGMCLTAVGEQRDPWLYAGTNWTRDADSGIEPGRVTKLSEAECELSEQLSRTAYYYLRQLRKILPQEIMLMNKTRQGIMAWFLEYLLPQIEAGGHLDITNPEWKDDTLEMVQNWRDSKPDNSDMNLLHAMGANLGNMIRGITSPLRVLNQDMIERIYIDGLGFRDGNADLAALVEQIAHQYPRMNIVEVGAGTGGTSQVVLEALQNQYASYTYTDISADILERARVLHSHHSKVTFKAVDVEKDPAEQGLDNGKYDMVIASNCLHKAKSLAESLRHCRQMLRPGGRLVLLEITRDTLPTQLVRSILPGWFIGREEGRIWGPTVTVERWDELLKANGFSGVDVTTTPSFCSVIMAQAVDDTVQLLREPLAAAPEALPSLGDLLIVTGGGAASSGLASQIQNLLQAPAAAATSSKTVTVVPSLDGIQVPQGSAVLCLAELDAPVFSAMNAGSFRGLQDIMATAGSVLWVTTGARSGQDPHANMVVGLSSTLRAEHMDLRLQFLDAEDPSALEPAMLAKMLLRLAILDPARDDLLWTQEPELAFESGGVYIPRVLALDAPNRRWAALRRKVMQPVDLASQSQGAAVVLEERETAWGLKTGEPSVSVIQGQDAVRVQVTASSLQKLSCNDGPGAVHVCIGRDLSSGDKVLALSRVNSPFVTIAAKNQILQRWQPSDEDTPAKDLAQLQAFLARALADRLLLGLQGPAWIHGAPADLDDALNVVARENGIAVFQTTSTMARKTATDVTFVHPYARESDLVNLQIPHDVQTFVNLSGTQMGALDASINALCSARAITVKEVELAGLTAGFNVSELDQLAKKYLTDGEVFPAPLEESVVPVEKASAGLPKDLSPVTVVDWSATEAVTAEVFPLQHNGLFSADKTYLLCGMTGDMGISVCLWMVDNGARHIVLTSRNPNVSPRVLSHLASKGASVRPMAVDITKLDSLRAAVTAIKADMPPIGGVMNGAMILRDQLFANILWDNFEAVLAPKVVGSQNLDIVCGDEPLDFFICFSSTTSILGNVGQSAYAAANHYMTGLVRQRRLRGLAASVLHIAILMGFGYIFRRDATHAETIYRAGRTRFNREAEPDLHAMLAEAIVHGRDYSQPAELITGVRTIFEEGDWRDDPRLRRYLGEGLDQGDASSKQAAGAVSVQAQLAEVGDDQAAGRVVLEKAFAIALGNLLEMDPAQIDPAMPVASLGIDSLVAIRIREWILREMGVDVSVLKIMSDTYSMSRMCDDVLVNWRKQKKEE